MSWFRLPPNYAPHQACKIKFPGKRLSKILKISKRVPLLDDFSLGCSKEGDAFDEHNRGTNLLALTKQPRLRARLAPDTKPRPLASPPAVGSISNTNHAGRPTCNRWWAKGWTHQLAWRLGSFSIRRMRRSILSAVASANLNCSNVLAIRVGLACSDLMIPTTKYKQINLDG